MKRRILVVDDQVNTLKVIGAVLQGEGYEVLKAKNAREALQFFEGRKDIDVILADLKMPDVDGLELFRRISAVDADVPYVIMTAYGSIGSAVEAMKEGVSDYLIKPLNYSELSIVLEKAISQKRMTRELAELRREIREKDYLSEIIGADPSMAEVFETVRTVAPTDVPVLIKGETGTGKELVAKAIHSLSTRCERAMVCVNSASLNDSLLEAELFGHVKGAFTGAISNKRGRLEASHKGTLFLDEIGQMSLRFQTKLLRFLQEGTFEPVGSEETRKVDVRLIAATNKDLREEIREGRFLSDLLYRIEVISINVPPLRSRKDDIPVLVNHFLRLFAAKYGKKITAVQAEAMEAMVRYPWPGNVRELENCIARAVILSKGSLIGLADVPERVRSRDAPARLGTGEKHLLALPEQGLSIREMERELVISTLEICSGNKTLAADRLGISRKALYEKMERYGIEG